MPFTESLKLKVKRRVHFACCLCHALGVEIHHIIPQNEGGPDTEENAAPLCPSCHETYGANPEKRKFIREARELWYEICEKRFASDPDKLDEIGKLIQTMASKEDLDKLVQKVENLLREIEKQPDRSEEDKTREISQVSGMISSGVSANRQCRNCNSLFGLVVGDQGRCPSCGAPW
ncbi:MAG: HNH endonuclease [Pyrinomonadaceae bacterium]